MLAGHGQGEAGRGAGGRRPFRGLQDSTALAERLSPTRFSELLRGFYALATEVITARGGTIDKFLGDGLVALFLPGPSGLDHARRALEAGPRPDRGPRPGRRRPPLAAGPHRGAQRPGLARPGAGSPRPRRRDSAGRHRQRDRPPVRRRTRPATLRPQPRRFALPASRHRRRRRLAGDAAQGPARTRAGACPTDRIASRLSRASRRPSASRTACGTRHSLPLRACRRG